MNEKTTMSRLSVFLFGAFVFILGASHSLLENFYFLTYILLIFLSFLSGGLLQKNKTLFRVKVLIFMMPSLVLFPVFNFYVREYPVNFCFLYPIFIYLMFIAGHSVKLKKNIVKSAVILFLSMIFIASSYFYMPVFLFYVNKKELNKPLPKVELMNLVGRQVEQDIFINKITILFFLGKKSEIDAISKKYENNNRVVVAKIVEESAFIQKNNHIVRDSVYNSYNLYFDENNLFLEKLDFKRKPGVFIVDKNSKIRYVHYMDYNHVTSFFYKKVIEEIDNLIAE